MTRDPFSKKQPCNKLLGNCAARPNLSFLSIFEICDLSLVDTLCEVKTGRLSLPQNLSASLICLSNPRSLLLSSAPYVTSYNNTGTCFKTHITQVTFN